MIETQDIPVELCKTSKLQSVDFENLPFGKVFSDHMLVAEFTAGKWHQARIVPYGDISLSPASSMIHYGQSIFEGLKAFKNTKGETLIFRPEENWKRMCESAERLCMPEIPKEIFLDGMRQLVEVDGAWIPTQANSSLYIRPFLFATDPFLGVKPSESYRFMIITSPVGPYYPKPLHLKIETTYTRAAKGGIGAAKAAGNYAGAMYPAMLAQKQGIDQLIWTDAAEHKYLEEAGTMNVMLVIDGVLLTPPLHSTILPGITRDSVLTLARANDIPVEERLIEIDELTDAIEKGSLQEVFGVGTAATVAHVKTLTIKDKTFELPALETRSISNGLAEQLMKIKLGEAPDKYSWNMKI